MVGKLPCIDIGIHPASVEPPEAPQFGSSTTLLPFTAETHAIYVRALLPELSTGMLQRSLTEDDAAPPCPAVAASAMSVRGLKRQRLVYLLHKPTQLRPSLS